MTKTPEREFLFVLVFYLIVLLFLTVVFCFFSSDFLLVADLQFVIEFQDLDELVDAVDVILVEVVDDDPAFLVVAEDLDLRCENALHIAHHLFEFDGDLSCLPRSLGDGFPCKVEAHSVLYLADGEFVVARLFCKVDEIVLVIDGDERSCVPGGELTVLAEEVTAE